MICFGSVGSSGSPAPPVAGGVRAGRVAGQGAAEAFALDRPSPSETRLRADGDAARVRGRRDGGRRSGSGCGGVAVAAGQGQHPAAHDRDCGHAGRHRAQPDPPVVAASPGRADDLVRVQAGRARSPSRRARRSCSSDGLTGLSSLGSGSGSDVGPGLGRAWVGSSSRVSTRGPRVHPQPGQGPRTGALHRAHRQAQRGRGVLLGQVAVVAQDDDGRLPRGQRGEQAPQFVAVVAARERGGQGGSGCSGRVSVTRSPVQRRRVVSIWARTRAVRA